MIEAHSVGKKHKSKGRRGEVYSLIEKEAKEMTASACRIGIGPILVAKSKMKVVKDKLFYQSQLQNKRRKSESIFQLQTRCVNFL